METWVHKVVALVWMLALTLAAGLLPIWLLFKCRTLTTNGARRRCMKRALSLLNCGVGGVFISTTFIHLLPEAREAIENVGKRLGWEDELPVTELVVCGGFFFVMFLEHLILVCIRHHNESKQIKEDKRPVLSSVEAVDTVESDSVNMQVCIRHHNESKQIKEDKIPVVSSVEAVDKVESDSVNMQVIEAGKVEVEVEVEDEVQPVRTLMSRRASLFVEGSLSLSHSAHHHHNHHDIQPAELASLRSLMLLLAIGIHTIFEGLAIGLQASQTRVWNLFAAIIVHKVIIVFSLGFNFAQNLSHRSRAILFIVLFSLMSPLGIGLGCGISVWGEGVSLSVTILDAVLQCVSTGTLLYVTFFEVLMAEVGEDHSLLKMALIFVGFAIMTLLNIFNHE